MTREYKNLRIRWIGERDDPVPNEAVIVSHGWYHTGWRMIGGTRNTMIPRGLTIRWYCPQGGMSKMSVSSGLFDPTNHAYARGECVYSNIGPQSVTDYFLAHKELFSPDPINIGNILITVKPPKGTKARLSDIIKARSQHGLNFSILHFTACREKLGPFDSVDF